jgi:hypothetical protein
LGVELRQQGVLAGLHLKRERHIEWGNKTNHRLLFFWVARKTKRTRQPTNVCALRCYVCACTLDT